MAQVSMAAIPALKDSFAQLKTRMDKAVEDFRKEMTATRTGRASVHMLDGVMVEAYGSQMPLNQLANVSAPESQLITVQPWDVSQIGAIEKAKARGMRANKRRARALLPIARLSEMLGNGLGM